jgi:hypothetical protein|tara:strand:+ start:647 stop:832 length:186 start_codon:yes stop_codon:yes gene_type:complete
MIKSKSKKPNSKEQNIKKTLMSTVEHNGGSKFIANLKTKANRNEVNTVLEKYDLPGAKRNL